MAKFNNDYLNRLLGTNEVNPTSGLSDPEVRKALEGYEKPNSTYREKFGDAGQGRAYSSTHKKNFGNNDSFLIYHLMFDYSKVVLN